MSHRISRYLRVERIQKAHSSPASASACLDRRDVLGIVELAQRERRGFDLDHGDRHAGDEEAQLLEPFERLELADRRRDIALERLGPIGIDADVQPHRRQLARRARPSGRCGISRFEK